MPFESKSQQRWMFSQKPEMAKRWAKETPNIKNLPEHVMNKTKILKKAVGKKYKGKGGPMDAFNNIATGVYNGVNRVGSGLKNLAGNVVNSYASGFKAVDAARNARDANMQTQNWGSPANYAKLQNSMPKTPKINIK